MIFIKKSCIPLWCIPYCLFPGRIVTWAWSLAKGQYMVSWLLTGAPEQRYWQNRETANIGLDSSVGRAPARQSGGHRFKSRSGQFSLFIQIYLKKKLITSWYTDSFLRKLTIIVFCYNCQCKHVLAVLLSCTMGVCQEQEVSNDQMTKTLTPDDTELEVERPGLRRNKHDVDPKSWPFKIEVIGFVIF